MVVNKIISAQELFDIYLKSLDQYINKNISSQECALIMAEVLMVKVKELFAGKGYSEDHALLFVEHALQELNEDKPTIH
mgnify:CR=1 FL=1|tara:strand:+ start:504 stop:740 length:237 start_codon:yes stop_codon:yes gene_type:complete